MFFMYSRCFSRSLSKSFSLNTAGLVMTGISFFFFLLLCVRLPGMFFPRCRETSCFQHEEKQNNARGRDEFQRMIHMEFCYGFFPGKTKKVVNVPMLVRVSSSLQEKADHSILMRPSPDEPGCFPFYFLLMFFSCRPGTLPQYRNGWSGPIPHLHFPN